MRHLSKLTIETKVIVLICIMNFILLFKTLEIVDIFRLALTLVLSIVKIYDDTKGFKNKTIRKLTCIIILIMLLIFITYVFLFS